MCACEVVILNEIKITPGNGCNCKKVKKKRCKKKKSLFNLITKNGGWTTREFGDRLSRGKILYGRRQLRTKEGRFLSIQWDRKAAL